MSNIYDFDYRWRFVATGDLLLFENATGDIISSIPPRELYGRFNDRVTEQEDYLKSTGKLPEDVKIDHFGCPDEAAA